jgi:ATP-dependent helicase/nuclease subunit A
LPLTTAQLEASNPQKHIWVTAHAGTGKTAVLSARYLRLLLEIDAKPETILCLTYTEAAAGEMHERVQKALYQLATTDTKKLPEVARNTYGLTLKPNAQKQIAHLLAELIDHPEKLKCYTIHGFSQSILKRFPLEANLPPAFTVLDEMNANVQARATWHELMNCIPEHQQLKTAYQTILGKYRPGNFHQYINDLVKNEEEWNAYERLLMHGEQVQTAYDALLVEPIIKLKTIMQQHHEVIMRYMASQNVSEKNIAAWQKWLKQDGLTSEGWNLIFITKAGTPRVNLGKSKNEIEQNPLIQIGEGVAALVKRENMQRAKEIQLAFLTLAQGYSTLMAARKARTGVLTYTDLIQKAEDLLNQSTMREWVRFKLDQNINHVLLDEAQDTSPTQWRMIQSLTEEFFLAGTNHEKQKRSLFVVGDEKQSIYGFQGANINIFFAMRSRLKQQAETNAMQIDSVPLAKSFRSSACILSYIDALCAQPAMKQALLEKDENIIHEAEYINRSGSVVLHPLLTKPAKEKRDGHWLQTQTEEHAAADAEQLVATIQNLLESKLYLASRGRSVEPQDILLLTLNRSDTFYLNAIIEQLFQKNIPFAGQDRIALSTHALTKDVLILMRALATPWDNFAQAALMVSPIWQQTEYQLFTNFHQQQPLDIPDWLQHLRKEAALLPPKKLLNKIFAHPHIHRAFSAQYHRTYLFWRDTLLQMVENMPAHEITTLPQLITAIAETSLPLKNDQSPAPAIRLTTVHGAKGLQAPIVMLIDACRTSGNQNKWMWHQHLPYLRSKEANPLHEVMQEERQASYNEYLRLLYVAVTRAEEHLHIFGRQAESKRNHTTTQANWYQLLQNAIQNPTEYTVSENHSVPEKKPDEKKPPQSNPSWLYSKPPLIKTRSSSVTEQTAWQSKTAAQTRGEIIHHLLEILPNIPAEKREELAQKWCQKQNLSDANRVAKHLAYLVTNSPVAFLFSGNRVSEVACANANWHGRIDVLLETNDTIWLVDFKTDKNPPINQADIPEHYRTQLMRYADIISPYTQQKTLKIGILWVETASLTVIAEQNQTALSA